jgi:hypothetical protein
MSHRGNPYDNAKAESFMKTNGLRNIRGRNRRSSPLPRRGLQSSEAPLCARLSKPRAVRRSPRPAEGQNRSLILSGLRGALQTPTSGDQSCTPNHNNPPKADRSLAATAPLAFQLSPKAASLNRKTLPFVLISFLRSPSSKRFFDIGEKAFAVDRAIEPERGRDAIITKRGVNVVV